jgi:hypothetical protein
LYRESHQIQGTVLQVVLMDIHLVQTEWDQFLGNLQNQGTVFVVVLGTKE